MIIHRIGLKQSLRFIAFQFFIFGFIHFSQSQSTEVSNNEMRCLMFNGFGGWSISTGDLKNDYGGMGEMGGGLLYQNQKKWLFGLNFSYFFGSNVKKDPIPNLRTPDGGVVGTDGSFATFEVFQRGFMFPMVQLGKTFWPGKPSKFNSLGGITAMIGGAWFQHWTHIRDLSKKTPQFSGSYLDGYDKMRSGPGFGAWLGYLYLPEHGKINFHLEAGYFLALTQTKRYDFAYSTPPGKKFTDGLMQIRLRICFAVRSRPEETYYYY